MHHPVEFRHFRSAATCYGMRQSSVYSLRVEDWIMLLFGWFFPLPCLRAPGRGVPVPGGPCPCFLLLLLVHDPNFVFRNFHQDVSRFTMHKGLRPNSRIMYRFFTSHQPMMNEQDQVTWTNWPASKKSSSGEQTSLLCTDVRLEYQSEGSLGSSWVAHVLFSVRVPD